MVGHGRDRPRDAKKDIGRSSSRLTTPSVAFSIAIAVSGNGFRRPFAISRKNSGLSPSLSAFVSFMASLVATTQLGVIADKSGWHIDTETQSSTKHAISFFLIKLIWPLTNRGLCNPQGPCEVALSSAKDADCFGFTHG